MSRFYIIVLLAVLCIGVTVAPVSAAIVTKQLSDFVIFSGGGSTTAGNPITSIGGHTHVNGNIGSNQDLFQQGNPLPLYPAQLDGSAYAGGGLTFGQDLTVGSSAGPLRDVLANGSASIGGGADIYGNVYGNTVTTGQNAGILQVSSSGGNLEYTTSYILGSGTTVQGSIVTPSTKTFAYLPMPAATIFTAGGASQTVPTGQGNGITLAPGTYGALSTTSQNQYVVLSSGDYYFDSITTQGGFDLRIDLSSGNPINIYVVGNVALAGQQTLMVKGAGTGGNFVPISDAPQLACLIYLETYGRFTMSGGLDGTHNIWGGTVYASKLEVTSAEISIGQYTDWYGAAYAFDSFATADHGYWKHVPRGECGVTPAHVTACKEDENGNPIPGWSINVDSATGVTGEDGCFVFTITPGDYTITEESRPDYEPVGPTSFDFTAVAGETYGPFIFVNTKIVPVPEFPTLALPLITIVGMLLTVMAVRKMK